MKRLLPLLLVAGLLQGCAAGAGLTSDPPPAASNPPPTQAQEGQAAAVPFAIPPIPNHKQVIPMGLRVSPDGHGYALFFALQGNGLAVWREGDAEAVMLSGVAWEEIAWTGDGLFLAHLTGPMEGQAQILRYRWGGAKPTIFVETDRLQGYPRALVWDAAGNRLLYTDDGGMRAVSADGARISRVDPPALPAAASGVFHPGSLRYLTLVREHLAVAAVDG